MKKKFKIFGIIFIIICVVLVGFLLYSKGYFTYYTVSVQVNNSSYGTVTGAGTYRCSERCVLTATGKGEYVFSEWTDGSTDNPRIIERVGQNYSFTAIFVHKDCYVSAQPNNSTFGTVTGGGEYEVGDTCTLTATANQGYHFVKWSDGSTENPIEIDVRKPFTITAIFEEGEVYQFNNGRRVNVKNGTITSEASNVYSPIEIEPLSESHQFGYWKVVETGEFFSDDYSIFIYSDTFSSNITLEAVDTGVGNFFATTNNEYMYTNFNNQLTLANAKNLGWISMAWLYDDEIENITINGVSNGYNQLTVNLNGEKWSDELFVLKVYIYKGTYYVAYPGIAYGAMISSMTIGKAQFNFNIS